MKASILTTLCLLATAAHCFAQAAPAPDAEPVAIKDSEKLSMIRQEVDRSVQLQRELTTAESNWQTGREILEDRIDFFRQQIEELKARTAEEESKIGEADKERADLEASIADLAAADDLAKSRLIAAEARARALTALFPAPLAEKTRPLAERLPKDAKTAEEGRLPVSNRFANLLGLLNEANKFHAEMTIVPERRDLADGRQIEVDTLYLGLGHAYYAGSGQSASEAGRGIPSPTGWQWEAFPHPEKAAASRKAIDILRGATPEFVPVPVSVTTLTGKE